MKHLLYLLLLGCLTAGTVAAQPVCSVDPRINRPGLYPAPLPSGRINELYDPVSMTVFFRADTVVNVSLPAPIPINLRLEVKFTEYTIDSVGGLPIGMEADLAGCSVPGCKYVIKENPAGCLFLNGTPEEFGLFNVRAVTTADGSFVMPTLPVPIPGLPAPGTVVVLSEAPAAFRTFLAPLRTVRYASSLLIEREPGTGCTPDAAFAAPGLYPAQMTDGEVNQEYPTTNLTAVFPREISFRADTTVSGPLGISIPVRATFNIRYRAMAISSSQNQPFGTEFDLTTCNVPGCRYILAEADRACLEFKGIPVEDGDFTPTLNLDAEGSFVMPRISALPIPGIPPAGTEVDLAEIPDLLLPILERYRRVNLSNNLTIKPDPTAPVRCTPEASTPNAPGLYPASLAKGKINRPYPKTKLTMVFPLDTLVRIDTTLEIPGAPIPIPVRADFDIKFTSFVVDTVVGLPEGMKIDLATCNRVECTYRLPAHRKGCIEMEGTPTQSGLFRPTVRAVGDGSFIMPDLGPLRQVIPFPIPEPGERVILSEATPALQFFLGPIRNRGLQTRLIIEPETYAILCKPEVAVSEGFVKPDNLADGEKDKAYPNTDLVVDFPFETALPIPGAGLLQVNYRSFTFDSTGDVPPGMRLEGYCKAGGNCTYELNEVDTALNRVCYTLSGTPTRGGIYNPRLIASSTGTVSIAGNTFRLERIPPGVPEDLRRVVDSLRTVRFATRLRVLPLVSAEEKLTAAQIGLSVYPNPTGETSEIVFRYPRSSEGRVTVKDLTGRILSEEKISIRPGTVRIPISAAHLTNGLYVAEIRIGSEVYALKWSVIK